MEVTANNMQSEVLPEDILSDQDTSQKIEEIIQAIDADGVNNVPLKIYKKENNEWEQVGATTADNVPTEHEVGLEYGGGKFKMLFSWKSPRHIKGRVNRPVYFTLGENYNSLMLQNRKKKNDKRILAEGLTPELNATPAQNAFGGDNLMMMLFNQMQAESRRMHELTLALINKGNSNQDAGLQKFYLEDLSKRSMLTLQHSTTAFEHGLKMGQEAQAKETESSEMMKIIEVIADSAPKILSVLTPKSTVQREIKNYPGAEEILNNPEKVRTVFNGVSERVGEIQARKIAEKIGVNGLDETPIKLRVV